MKITQINVACLLGPLSFLLVLVLLTLYDTNRYSAKQQAEQRAEQAYLNLISRIAEMRNELQESQDRINKLMEARKLND